MRLVKVIVFSALCAGVVYGLFRLFTQEETILSPIPKNKIQILEIRPTKNK